MFIAIAWLPKGSVNAVVGGMIAEYALKLSDSHPGKEELTRYGDISLSAALISILITAPIGAIASMVLGPMWLDKETDEERREREAAEKDYLGEEAYEENKKKEKEAEGSVINKTLGTNPKMMVARSVSNRDNFSHRSKKSLDIRKAS